jgi:hypothetical protein
VFQGGNQLALLVANAKRLFHVAKRHELRDSWIPPNGIRKITRVVDAGPKVRPDHGSGIIYGKGQYATMLEQ